MLSYENLAAREQLWSKFGADPEWKKLRATPGLSDAEIVSNISNAILRPAAKFSNPVGVYEATKFPPVSRRAPRQPRRFPSAAIGRAEQETRSDESRNPAFDRRGYAQRLLGVRRGQHLFGRAFAEVRREVVRGRADAAAREGGEARHHAGGGAAAAELGLHHRAEYPEIMLGKSPERDRAIDNICQMIRNCKRAGIPDGQVQHDASWAWCAREPTPGRGSSTYSTFNYEKAKAMFPPLTEAGPVSAEQVWERIDYFLQRVVPVATEEKVKMACHPHDPGMPEVEGFRGVHRVLGSVDGLKKFVDMHASPYHGLNFCQGTVSEMLKDPNKEIHDVIRYFGWQEEDLQRPFPQHQGRLPQFSGDVPGWRRRELRAGDPDLPGGRLRRDADARPRSQNSRRHRRADRRSRLPSDTSRR